MLSFRLSGPGSPAESVSSVGRLVCLPAGSVGGVPLPRLLTFPREPRAFACRCTEDPQKQRQRRQAGKQEGHHATDHRSVGDGYHQCNVKPGYRDNIHDEVRIRMLGGLPVAQLTGPLSNRLASCGAGNSLIRIRRE